MFVTLFLLSSCIAASLASGLYVPQQPQIVREAYHNGPNHANLGIREYNNGAQRDLKNVRDFRADRSYDQGEAFALKDDARQLQYKKGAEAAVHAAGAKDDVVRQALDKGLYAKEKNYGYEKAYGYEKEIRQHDKEANNQAQGNRYQYDEQRAQHNQGVQGVRDIASQGQRYNRGAAVQLDREALYDAEAAYKRGRVVDNSQYNNANQLRYVQVPQQVVVQKNYVPVYDTYSKYGYPNGVSGIGGLYGNGYEYGPLNYGYNYGYSPVNYGYYSGQNYYGQY